MDGKRARGAEAERTQSLQVVSGQISCFILSVTPSKRGTLPFLILLPDHLPHSLTESPHSPHHLFISSENYYFKAGTPAAS